MMNFKQYINEQNKKSWSITFIDVDDTVFHTFAMIKVIKDGKVVTKLTNQEFNAYTLKDGESYDFGEFRSSELFNKTSIPIPKTVKRIKKMLSRIKETGSKSKIIFLTARSDFDDKKVFLDTFEKHGISMDRSIVYVERAGGKDEPIEATKKRVMLSYLKTGLYRRVRLIDDFKPNVMALKSIEKNLPKEIEDKVRKKYNLSDNEEAIKFWALWIDEAGNLKEL